MRTCKNCPQPAEFLSAFCPGCNTARRRADKKRKGKRAMRSIIQRYCVLHPTNKIHFNF